MNVRLHALLAALPLVGCSTPSVQPSLDALCADYIRAVRAQDRGLARSLVHPVAISMAEETYGKNESSYLDFMLKQEIPSGDVRCTFQPVKLLHNFENNGLAYRKDRYVFEFSVPVTHNMDIFHFSDEKRVLLKSVAIRAEQSSVYLIFPFSVHRENAKDNTSL